MQRAELEQLADDFECLLAQCFRLFVVESQPVGGRVHDLGEPQTAVEGRDHFLRVGRGIDRVLRPFGDVDAAFDVDGAAACALELSLETQARGDSDALLQQRFVVSELRKPGASFESAQDLIARIVEVLLVELVDSCAMSTAGTLVEDDCPLRSRARPRGRRSSAPTRRARRRGPRLPGASSTPRRA